MHVIPQSRVLHVYIPGMACGAIYVPQNGTGKGNYMRCVMSVAQAVRQFRQDEAAPGTKQETTEQMLALSPSAAANRRKKESTAVVTAPWGLTETGNKTQVAWAWYAIHVEAKHPMHRLSVPPQPQPKPNTHALYCITASECGFPLEAAPTQLGAPVQLPEASDVRRAPTQTS